MQTATADKRMTDEQLAVCAADGCCSSFEQLAVRFQVPLVQFLALRTGSREDAEDLAQDTLVRAYRNLHRYDNSWRFSTWLYTIARRLCINWQRRQRTRNLRCCRQEGACLEAVASTQPGPYRRVAERETRGQLWDTVARTLDEEKFTALWLHYAEDVPVAEIACVLGRSRVAVKTMMFRARKQLEPVLRGNGSEIPVPAAATPAGRRDVEHLLLGRRLIVESSGI